MKRYEIRPVPAQRPLAHAETDRSAALAELLVHGPDDAQLNVFEAQMVKPLQRVFEGARYDQEFIDNEIRYNLNQFGLQLIP